LSNQNDEYIPYEQFFPQMKKLNVEQRIIVDDVVYRKNKYSSKPLHLFLTRGARIGKKFTFMCLIQNLLQYYKIFKKMLIL
jgi:hypothetical protein